MPSDLLPGSNSANIEKPRPTLEQLYALYGYQPPNIEVGQETLAFGWTPEQMDQMAEVLCKVLDRDQLPIDGVVDEGISFENGMEFRARWFADNEVIEIKFKDEDFSRIASFRCGAAKKGVRTNNEWILTHRIVSEKYRNQEIGSKMLQILERELKHIAGRRKTAQVLKIEARQLGVINFAFKNGFKLSEAGDRENLDLIYSGDPSKILIATAPMTRHGEPRPGFIFSIPHLQELARQANQGDLGPEDVRQLDLNALFRGEYIGNYKAQALTINFEKKEKP